MTMKSILLTFILISICLSMWSQPESYSTPVMDRPRTSIYYIDDAPLIDGSVLNEEIWQSIDPLDDLIQTRPNLGLPATEPTEIRIAQDASSLFVSVICYDNNPEKLVVADARRDASLDNTDAFLFVLDTYNDGRNGFMFGTNPAGVQYDAQVDNEGQGNFNSNRQQGGTIGGFNLNWDASWTVKTVVGEFGWSAEFQIPLRTLRFAEGTNKIWGINFRRNIRKSNEVAYWAPMPVVFDLKRVSMAGKIDGLQLQKANNLKLIPYGLVRTANNYNSSQDERINDAEFGVDAKYGITPSLTLDLTYNTDFAQVEVDDQQVNLDRFNLFFPEKRPFFLENAGQFTVGSPGEVDIFFSRKIGISDNGQPVPIIGGARLSGKENKTNIGFLNMFTEELPDIGIARNNFTVARINHEFQGRSAIGAVFTNRLGLGDESENDYNRVFALDGRWGIGQSTQFSGFLAKSVTPEIDGDQYAFKGNGVYNWNGWEMAAAYTEVGTGFNPEVGFLFRKAFRKPEFRILYHYRPTDPNSKILELRPHISYRSYWNFQNFLETSFLHIDNHWEFKSGTEIHTGINFTTEGVTAPFEISDGIVVPTGSFDHAEAQLVFFTNASKPFYVSTRHVLGGFFGGKRYNNTVTLGFRMGDKLNADFTLNRNDIKLPQGNFDTNIFRAGISYAFRPNIFIQSLIQYNSVTDKWSSNVRFGWLNQANSGLFIVFNELRDDIGVENRNFIVKYSYMFDVLHR